MMFDAVGAEPFTAVAAASLPLLRQIAGSRLQPRV
jgi:hypothetical protein